MSRMLASEMMHFVNQVQYYLLFEVLESNWQQMEAALQSARSFNQILSAHDVFLAALLQRMFLLPHSQV